jgi:adenylate kinase
MRMAFIGPPGAGKSTQAKRVARSLLYPNHSPRFSSGDLVRAEVEASTDLGREMESYRRGERVPDETLLPLLLPRLRRSGGFMLDNFPATVSQARALDEELEGSGAGALSRVICLEGPSDEELLERILGGRRTSSATGEVYHLQNDPPPGPSERLDPGPFLRRSDDTEESIRAHLEAYRHEADALKEHYEEAGLLTVVDAGRPMGEVTEAILGALGHPERPEFYARSRGGLPA